MLPFYQARAGQVLTLAIGVARLRDYSVARQRTLVAALAERGVHALGGGEDRGAFVVVPFAGGVKRARRPAASAALAARGVVTDARGRWLRLCPDVLTTEEELVHAAAMLPRCGPADCAGVCGIGLAGDHSGWQMLDVNRVRYS